MRTVMLVGCLLGLAACARVEAPPGGTQDTQPPLIVETEPAQNEQATAFIDSNRPVRIVFDETISERSPRELVQVSPETGRIDVDRDGNELRVTIEGGWQRDKVYHVTVLPGLVDRRGNARGSAYELVFSTGAPILPNAAAGLVTDRITGRPVAGARVEAVKHADSTMYTTVTDSGGFYALRSLPIGLYETRVYTDQNRNRALDPREARGITNVNVANATDTITVELTLLTPDTTPARLLRAEIRDSLQVRLFFDDYTDPTNALASVRVTAWELPDSVEITGGSVMSPRGLAALRADTTADPAPPVPPQAAQPDTGRVLPVNELVWLPPRPLTAGVRYRFNVTGYLNITNVPDGGGSVTANAPEPRPAAPPPAPAPVDTTGAADG